jgi:aryl-alcohol dehydrogenase-like predicted oxidoreductase
MLDGARWSEVMGQRLGPTSPHTLRELSSEFSQIEKFGFLTSRRQRTLAQAALDFALAQPGTLLVHVPMPAEDQIDAVIGRQGAHPLTREELALLERPSAARSGR